MYQASRAKQLRKCVHDWQVLDSVPKVPMYRPKSAEPRFLTPGQYEHLATELPEHLKLAARFAVLTGLRMRSMLALEWSRIDMKQQRAWVPSEQMKADRTHGIPLSKAAIAVLKGCVRFSRSRKRNTEIGASGTANHTSHPRQTRSSPGKRPKSARLTA